PLAAAATPGTYQPLGGTTPTLIARVSAISVSGLQYVPTGTYAGDLLYTSFDSTVLQRLDIDRATGLPFGTVNAPTEAPFASCTNAPDGIEMDPITNDDL